MKPHSIKRYLLTALLVAALLPACVLAAGSATVTTNGTQAQVYWANGMIRMNPGNSPGYMILRDGRIYSVTDQGGQTRVIDMTGMVQAASGMAQSGNAQLPLDATVESVVATGETATVAGIKGRVYEVTLTTKKGETRTQTLVLTDNPRVVEMTQAYMTALRSFIGPEKMGQLMQQLPADDRGLLRAGTDYRLTSISGAAPSAALFELPAEPSSLADMLQDMIQRGTRQ